MKESPPAKNRGPANAPARRSFLVFGQPLIEEEEIAEVVATAALRLDRDGPRVAQFEADFARLQGCRRTRSRVNSCTAALHLAMLAAGLEPGDEVITTPMTFCATVNAIVHAGATPVLADVDPGTMNIDPDGGRSARSRRARGRSCRCTSPAGRATWTRSRDRRASTASQIIEDCAHAIETEYRGPQGRARSATSAASASTSTKNIVTGEGGMVHRRGARRPRRAIKIARRCTA